MPRIIFLNALPLNSINYDTYTVWVKRWSFELLIKELKNVYFIHAFRDQYEVLCFIRHPATVKVLNEILKEVNVTLTPSPELYIHKETDIIYVVTLKQQKIERGKEVTELTKDDLEIYEITIAKGLW